MMRQTDDILKWKHAQSTLFHAQVFTVHCVTLAVCHRQPCVFLLLSAIYLAGVSLFKMHANSVQSKSWNSDRFICAKKKWHLMQNYEIRFYHGKPKEKKTNYVSYIRFMVVDVSHPESWDTTIHVHVRQIHVRTSHSTCCKSNFIKS